MGQFVSSFFFYLCALFVFIDPSTASSSRLHRHLSFVLCLEEADLEEAAVASNDLFLGIQGELLKLLREEEREGSDHTQSDQDRGRQRNALLG